MRKCSISFGPPSSRFFGIAFAIAFADLPVFLFDIKRFQKLAGGQDPETPAR